MSKYSQRPLTCLVALCLLASCNALELNVDHASSSVSTETSAAATPIAVSPTASGESTATEGNVQKTPSATPTFMSIFDTPAPITDGILKLSINISENKCHKPSDFISLTIQFQNLTSKPLTIVDYNALDTHALFGTRAQLYPVLASSFGGQIFTPYDFVKIDSFNHNSPLYHELAARSMFEFRLNYYFSPEIVNSNIQGPKQDQPTPAGQYLLKLIYAALPNNGAWEGTISSNWITICIVN